MEPALLATDSALAARTDTVSQQPASSRPRVLVFTTLFPNPAQPRLGIFVRDRVVAVAVHCPTRVVAPILIRLGSRQLDQGSTGGVPFREQQAGLEVDHPRFATVPGFGRFVDGTLLFLQTLAHVRRLHSEFEFDLIDAHYAFPDGAAAVLLGRQFGVPVCVTLRGGDIDVLTRFRMRRRMIRHTIERADRVFAVSHHLARGAAALGVDPARIQVVANGVDPDKFYPVSRVVARRNLGVDDQDRLVLCVGNLVAEKGHHVLIEALAQLRVNREVPHLVIVGSHQQGKRDYQEQLERRILALNLAGRVRILGSKSQKELRDWYSASDVVVLPTFREGCPNVVREALACGAPVVASRVGGVPELLTSEHLGLLVKPGDARELAAAITAALERQWDRSAIAAATGQRTWRAVAAIITTEFRAMVQGPLPASTRNS